MRFVRQRLAVLAVALLLLQGSSVMVSAWFSCCAPQQTKASPMDCCKDGVSATGQMCPMHHGQAATAKETKHHEGMRHDGMQHESKPQESKPQESKRCAMRESCSPDRSFLLSLFADVGFPLHTASIELQHAAALSVTLAESPIGRAVAPDSPPPRL